MLEQPGGAAWPTSCAAHRDLSTRPQVVRKTSEDRHRWPAVANGETAGQRACPHYRRRSASRLQNYTVKVVDANGISDSQAVALVVVAAPSIGITLPRSVRSASATPSVTPSPVAPPPSPGRSPSERCQLELFLNTTTGQRPRRRDGRRQRSRSPCTSWTLQSQAGNLASSINIVASPSLTNPPPPGGAVSVPYSTTLTVTGGVGPFSWVIDSGNLPNGLSLGASSRKHQRHPDGRRHLRLRCPGHRCQRADGRRVRRDLHQRCSLDRLGRARAGRARRRVPVLLLRPLDPADHPEQRPGHREQPGRLQLRLGRCGRHLRRPVGAGRTRAVRAGRPVAQQPRVPLDAARHRPQQRRTPEPGDHQGRRRPTWHRRRPTYRHQHHRRDDHQRQRADHRDQRAQRSAAARRTADPAQARSGLWLVGSATPTSQNPPQ